MFPASSACRCLLVWHACGGGVAYQLSSLWCMHMLCSKSSSKFAHARIPSVIRRALVGNAPPPPPPPLHHFAVFFLPPQKAFTHRLSLRASLAHSGLVASSICNAVVCVCGLCVYSLDCVCIPSKSTQDTDTTPPTTTTPPNTTTNQTPWEVRAGAGKGWRGLSPSRSRNLSLFTRGRSQAT